MLRTVDLFCGAGGLSEGFRQAGFTSVYANDFEKPALETFRRNFPDTACSDSDVREIDASSLREELDLQRGQLDALIGGPPCQGFSTYGQRREDDERNKLYLDFIRFLDEFRPKTYVIENVTGLISMSRGAVLADIITRIEALGYSTEVLTLDACEFGVPQHRKRVFILGGADGQKLSLPTPTHVNGIRTGVASVKGQGLLFDFSDLLPAITVREAISDLPQDALKPKETHMPLEYVSSPATSYQKLMRDNQRTLTHHAAKQMLGIRHLRLALMHPGDYGTKIDERLKNGGLPDEIINKLLGAGGLRDINECRTEDRKKEIALREMLSRGNVSLEDVKSFIDSQGFANKYRRLRWETPSHTLVAHMARDCSDFVHPEIDRFVTVREAARLQSFKDSYYFTGSQFHQFRQIGNAVPPLLAKAIASVVRESLS